MKEKNPNMIRLSPNQTLKFYMFNMSGKCNYKHVKTHIVHFSSKRSKSRFGKNDKISPYGETLIGLEGFNGKSASSGYKEKFESKYEVVWSNQFEPSTKTQHANLVYENQWPNANHCGENIEEVSLIFSKVRLPVLS